MTDSSHIPLDGARATTYRVLGPPGCGKTTWLIRQAERFAGLYGPASVRVVSMTKTASREFAKRDSIVPSENVSTLHALAYRAIGKPGVIGKADIERWNHEQPGYALSGEAAESEDGRRTATFGDALLLDLDLCRAKCLPPWYPELAEFAAVYGSFKREIERVDYTGMLEDALDRSERAPGNPDALLADEGQDFSTLELRLFEKWAQHCRVVVIVGDKDQSMYSWRGADQRVLASEGRPPFKVLEQSHRVPRAVQELALGVIRRSSTWSRAEYRPKIDEETGGPVEGIVARTPLDFAAPAVVVDDLESQLGADPLSDFMLIAQCGYMLSPLIEALRARGIGYHNPYRAEWNPLARGGRDKVTGADKVLAFARLSCPRDWRIAMSCLASETSGGPVRRGAKQEIAGLRDDATMADVAALLSRAILPGGLDLLEHGGSGTPASASELRLFLGACTKAEQASMEFPSLVYRAGGVEALASPRVVIGTIHSVKGGEADHVYLNTALSPSARRSMDLAGWDGEDSIWRTFYVGATRARHRLVVCGMDLKRGVNL